MGRRVFETIGADWRGWPPSEKRVTKTTVYLPQQVAADFRERRGLMDHFEFMASNGWVEIVELEDGSSVDLDGCRVTPVRLAEEYVYCFLLESDGKRVLIAPDELNGWTPPGHVRGLDLAVVPAGIAEHHPLTGERRIDADHPVLRFEATFAETQEIIGALRARRVVLSHIEEMDRLSHDEWLEIGERYGVEIAFDGLVLDV
jgi:phosphoribosyl 1,2-cyclic phosphate phosphodiesterase